MAKAIRHEEPRVVLIDAAAFSERLNATHLTLADVLAAARDGHDAPAADYVLSVADPTNRQLHDTGAAAPFLFVPSVVGYEKIQSTGTLSALLLNLQDPQALEVLCASSTYSEVTAGLFYGVMTIALPEPALRDALAHEVTRTLTQAQPTGPIRLLVLSQNPRSPGAKPAATTGPNPAAGRGDPGCSANRIPEGTVAAAVH